MKKLNSLTITAIVLVVSVSAWASTGSHENDQAGMPMMNEGENSSMMGHHQQHNMNSMGGGNGGMMANPQMMQMRQQHMSDMEQRLANIEDLLTKLIEVQKP